MEILCLKLRNFGNSVFKITELWKFRVRFRNIALIHLNYGEKKLRKFHNFLFRNFRFRMLRIP